METDPLTLRSSHHFHRSQYLLAIHIFVGLAVSAVLAAALILYSHTVLEGSARLIFTLFGAAVVFVIQIILVLYTVLRWANTDYYISNHHLVCYQGIWTRDENIYELQSLRTVEMKESLFGRWFHYGDVYLVFSASGYRDEIWLTGIGNAKAYVRALRAYIGDDTSPNVNPDSIVAPIVHH